jgi:hypothetical protein
MSAHVLYAVKVDSTVIGGVTEQSGELNSEIMNEPADGLPWATWIAMNAQNPMKRFTTKSVAPALTTLAPPVVNIADLTAGFTMYLQKLAEGGLRTSGSNHRSFTMVSGIIVPRRLTCDAQGDAELQFSVIPTWNQSDAILSVADSVALPTLANASVRFALGGITIAGVTVDSVVNLDLDFGITEKVLKGDGHPLPLWAGVERYQPKLTLRTFDATLAASGSIPTIGGKAATHANTIIYLRKRTATGFVADATAEHIKLTMAGHAHVEPFDARGTSEADLSVMVDSYYDGTNAPLVVDAASAIS